MQRLLKAAFGLAFLMAAGSTAMAFQKPVAAPAEVATADDAAPADKPADAAPDAPADAAAAGPGPGDPAFDAAMKLGEELYAKNCVECHGAEGDGPARVFAGSKNMEYVVLIASQVIYGGEFMPKFPMSDEEAAAVATYIRNSWGNQFGMVTPEEIAQYR
jgi:mono/diheme cytochrome c family protein